MGREFTNALQQTPLWQFALHVYTFHQAELLTWQNDHSAQVNDLIAIAFCVVNSLNLPATWWLDARLVTIRAMTARARALRIESRGAEHYDLAKKLELNLEGLDIQRLEQLTFKADTKPDVQRYECHLGTKKGALAPLIERLVGSA